MRLTGKFILVSDASNITMAVEYMELVVENVTRLLHERRMTQREFAKQSGLPDSSVSRILSGETKDIELKTLCALAKGLKVPMSFLLQEQVEPGTAPERKPTWAEVVWVLTALLDAGQSTLLSGLLTADHKVKPKTPKD